MEHITHLKDAEARKNPEAVFKAIADTLEISISYWNYIDGMYSINFLLELH